MTCWTLARSTDVPTGDRWLSHDERAQLERFTVPKRRDDWRLGRWVAKRAAAGALSCDPAAVEVLATTDGPPVLRVEGMAAAPRLSISHRDGRAVAVLADPDTAVGCDLELVEPRSRAFVREWLHREERGSATLGTLGADVAVNLMWTGKEAAAKALGGGLRLDVRNFVVRPGLGDHDDGWRPLSVGCGDSGSLAGWWRREGPDVLTVVTAPGGGPPRRLAS